jgi:hypothetical protein
VADRWLSEGLTQMAASRGLVPTGNASALVVTSDAEAAAKAAREARHKGLRFVWTQLRELSDFYEARWRPPLPRCC